jgi:hypothetical protein
MPKRRAIATDDKPDVLSLKTEVKDALLGVLRDDKAPAMAKASAGRTLIDIFREDEASNDAEGRKPVVEMSEADIDAEIARLSDH